MIKKLIFAGIVLLSSFYMCAQSANAGLPDKTARFRNSDEGFASQEFRRGVQAYYRGSFNEAILQFEKALSFLPEDNLILYWLGKAYYSSGLEGTALQAWKRACENGYGGLLLENQVEIVKERRVFNDEEEIAVKYTESGSYPGTFNGNMIYSQPVSVLPNKNGTFWVLAYGSNELLLINVNGQVINRVTGPLNGFDHPVDIIRLHNGKMLVSEAMGDRLAVLSKKGKFEKYIGKKGIQSGCFMGPQYICEDSRKNIYVSDYGNRRIDVFNKDGESLFNFGKASSDFSGFRGPTGIAVVGDYIYCADDVYGSIFVFDQAGNFIRELVERKTFKKPESLKVWKDYLVVCDSNKVFSVDTQTGAVYENMNTGNAPSRLTSAVPDVNGNILVTDFTANEVYVMAKMKELVGGFFVQIERVNAEKFPLVYIDVKVENRHQNPVVGLRENNFYVTEDRRPVSKLKFVGEAGNNENIDITILIDRSVDDTDKLYRENVESIVRSVAKNMNGKGTLRIVSAGNVPSVEYKGSPKNAYLFSMDGLKTPVSNVVPLDLSLRLCANDLVTGEKKRAVILIGDGKVTLNAFDKFSLSEMTSYYNNNSISLAYVKAREDLELEEEVDYLVSKTKGSEYFVWQEEGLDGIVSDLLEEPVGVYVFQYVSALSTNFGENYLPVEVEAYLMNRSGRDETGYFSPLQ